MNRTREQEWKQPMQCERRS